MVMNQIIHVHIHVWLHTTFFFCIFPLIQSMFLLLLKYQIIPSDNSLGLLTSSGIIPRYFLRLSFKYIYTYIINIYVVYKTLISRGRTDTGKYFLSLRIDQGKAEVNMARKILGQYQRGRVLIRDLSLQTSTVQRTPAGAFVGCD